MNKGLFASFVTALKKPFAGRVGVLLKFGTTTAPIIVASYLTDASANVLTDDAGNRLTLS